MLRTSFLLLLIWSAVCSMRTPGKAPTTVIFVNCAETTGNGGEAGLSLTGKQQSAHLAGFLKDMEIGAVYSPYSPCLIKTVEPLAQSKKCQVQYYRDATMDNMDAMEHILKTMMEANDGKTIVVCAPGKSIIKMAGILGIREKELKSNRGVFDEVLIVNVLEIGQAVAQKLNMNFQKKV
jgi:hypothetical protein